MNSKPDCAGHPKELFGESDMRKVAEAIGDLHYETLAELFGNLAEKIRIDSLKDQQGGRHNLADKLCYIYHAIAICGYAAEEAYEISKPFMNNTQNNQP